MNRPTIIKWNTNIKKNTFKKMNKNIKQELNHKYDIKQEEKKFLKIIQ